MPPPVSSRLDAVETSSQKSGSVSSRSGAGGTQSSGGGRTPGRSKRLFTRRSRRDQHNQRSDGRTIVKVGTLSSSRGSSVGSSFRLLDNLLHSLERRPSQSSKPEQTDGHFFSTVLAIDEPQPEVHSSTTVIEVNHDRQASAALSHLSSPCPTLCYQSDGETIAPSEPSSHHHRQRSSPTPPNIDSWLRRSAGAPPVRLTQWRTTAQFDEPQLTEQREPRTPTRLDGANHGEVDVSHLQQLPQLIPRIPPHPMTFRLPSEDDDNTTGCCGLVSLAPSTAIRWFIAVISILGLCCVVVGIVLGALTVSGSTRLTLCLLMIGVGIVLITVSGIAWRLTALDTTAGLSCWHLLGFDCGRQSNNRSYTDPLPPLPRGYARMRSGRPPPPGALLGPPPMGRDVGGPGHVSSLYPDFPWQPPPPTYQASMQEQRLQRILEDGNGMNTIRTGSPPPTYRSQRRPVRAPAAPGNQESPDQTPTGAAVPAAEPVSVSDRARLVPQQQAMSPPTARTVVSVVDCSQASPQGYEMRESNRSEVVLDPGGLNSSDSRPPPYPYPPTPNMGPLHRHRHPMPRPPDFRGPMSPPPAMSPPLRIPRPLIGPFRPPPMGPMRPRPFAMFPGPLPPPGHFRCPPPNLPVCTTIPSVTTPSSGATTQTTTPPTTTATNACEQSYV